MRTFLLLLSAIVPASASVTYTLHDGFSVTTPDFIPNLARWGDTDIVSFSRLELSSCAFPDTAWLYCAGALISYFEATNTIELQSRIIDTFDSATLTGQIAQANTDLSHAGMWGRISITVGTDPVTAFSNAAEAPEPSTLAFVFTGLAALFTGWRLKK